MAVAFCAEGAVTLKVSDPVAVDAPAVTLTGALWLHVIPSGALAAGQETPTVVVLAKVVPFGGVSVIVELPVEPAVAVAAVPDAVKGLELLVAVTR